jgi:hypothetical protein
MTPGIQLRASVVKGFRQREHSLENGSRKTVKPEIAMSVAQAQAIVDRAGSGRTVAQLPVLHGGEIGAVYEISMADGPPSLVLKIYPSRMSRRSGIRCADKDMRQLKNLRRFPIILDH